MDPRLKEIGAALGRMIHGYQGLGLLAAAAELGLWAALRDGPKTTEQLAAAAGVAGEPLGRLLAGLSMIGALRRVPHDGSPSFVAPTYQLTALGQAASDPRLPFADQITLAAGEYAPAWLHMGRGLRTGAIPFDAAFDQSVWQHRKNHPEVGAAFDRVMARVQVETRAFVVAQCDLSSNRTLVDVGGGAGLLCAGLLQSHSQLAGIVFDQPHLAAVAKATLARLQLGGRCRFVEGDFFESVPRGDVLLLQHVLHDWDDDQCVQILTNCRAALEAGGRLLLVERLVGRTPSDLGAPPEPSDTLRDLHMLCLTGGRERTAEEYTALLARCGFDKARSVISGAGADLIEARAK